jgi:tryptophan 2,3-dioxygenase
MGRSTDDGEITTMAANLEAVDQLPKSIRSLLDTPYAQYLGLESIFDIQVSEGVPVELNHAEEVIFRTVHMSSELWLRLAGFEIERARAAVEAGQIITANRLALRARMSVDRVMEATAMLQMMPATDYHAFRTELGSASGLQSPGYAYLRRECKTLSSAFDAAVGDDDALFALYMGDRNDPRYDLAEALLELDATLDRFRALHLQIAERFLGGNTQGTGGSEGVPYLKRNIGHKLFPRLWEIRGRIATASGATAYGYGTTDSRHS